MADQQAQLDAFLAWAAQATKTETERKEAAKAKLRPPAKVVVPYVPPETDYCPNCRLTLTCKRDFSEGITFGKSDTPHGKCVTECQHISDIADPLPDEVCWFCNKPNCDFGITVKVLCDTTGNNHIYEGISSAARPVHDVCYDLYLPEDIPGPALEHPTMKIIPPEYEKLVINYLERNQNETAS